MQRLAAEERRLGWFMMGCGVVYLAVGLGFWVFPAFNQQIAGLAGVALGLAERDVLPAPLWTPLAVSMMFTIATCSALAAIDPRRNRVFVLPVLVSKAVSTLCAASLLLAGVGQASALGVILTDLPLLLITLWLYVAAVRSVNGSWLR